MKTIKLYENDGMCRCFTAVVLSCKQAENAYHVILDRTAFFPEGGGQTADRGTLGAAKVLDTQIIDGEIVHITDAPLSGEVEGILDFDERFRKMQNHMGEHLLCGAIHRLYGFTNVGFHLGANYMTFDIDGVLTDAEIEKAEREANLAVFADAPIRCYTPDAEMLKTLSYRAKTEKLHGDSVRIVEAEGFDICACCAPHLDRTGKVGQIKITERMKYKGGMRFTTLCGSDALLEHGKKQKVLEELSLLLSAKKDSIPEAVTARLAEIGALKMAVGALRRELCASRLSALSKTESNILLFEHTLDRDGIRAICTEGVSKTSGIFAAFSGNDDIGYDLACASSTTPLRPLATELASAFGGKCGGSDKMIFGHLPATEAAIRTFFKEKDQ